MYFLLKCQCFAGRCCCLLSVCPPARALAERRIHRSEQTAARSLLSHQLPTHRPQPRRGTRGQQTADRSALTRRQILQPHIWHINGLPRFLLRGANDISSLIS